MEKFILPDDLKALSVDDLKALSDKALEEYGTLRKIADDDLTDEQVDRVIYLGESITALKAEGDGRIAAATERKDRLAAAATSVEAAKKTAEPKAPDTDPVTAPVENPNPKASEPGDPADQGTPPPTETVGTRVASAAGSRSLVASAPKNEVRRPRPDGAVTITASADVPGYGVGAKMDDLAEVAKAFTARSKSFPRAGHQPGRFDRYGVAQFAVPVNDNAITLNQDSDYDVIERVANERNLNEGSLVASGGWCAPSETFYDLCTTESLDGLIDLPEVQVKRGGIRFTKGPSFADIYASEGFVQTEAQAIAGTTKPCAEVTCPAFQEVRLDVIGFCVRAPILTNVGYPELVQRWLEGTLVAHQHKVSARVINSMVAIAGAATTLNGIAGTFLDTMGSLEWVVETQRYRYRLGFNETLEVVLPHWVLAILRQDIALRTGQNDPVTDAQINAHFANRHVRVQWVTDWQPLVTSGTGSNACVAATPTTFDILVYPAGTFVKGTADVISLDTVYDTTDLSNNMYMAAFVEEGILVANRCYDACRLTMPVNMMGATGAPLAAGTKWLPRVQA